MSITVQVYTPIPCEGPALDPARPWDLESEIREIELVQQRNLAARHGLDSVVARADEELRRLRFQREIPYPLLTPDELLVWQAFLPTCYRSPLTPRPAMSLSPTGGHRDPHSLERDYRFDVPPVSVLDAWQAVKDGKVFDAYEIWTPERPKPEPILVGYRSTVGPFLIAQWGEALQPFEEIRRQVEERRKASRAIQQQLLGQPLPSVFSVPPTFLGQ